MPTYCFVLCRLICIIPFLRLGSSTIENYKWNAKETYYYNTLQQKLDVILYGRCLERAQIMPEHAPIKPPNSSEAILVFPKPPLLEIVQYWTDIPRPKQMRVDPNLCEGVYIKRKPIFKNTGCQLPHYMSPAAPRCQTSYLKWICESSQMNVTTIQPNYFIMPEADHQTWPKPPIPWLMVVKEAMVSMCGQISMSCGFMHTNANCKATGYINQAMAFSRHCPKPSDAMVHSSNTIANIDLTFIIGKV